MGYVVSCPVCGVDGTALANELIAERLGALRPAAPGLRFGREVPARETDPPIPPNALSRTRASSGAKVPKKTLFSAVCGSVLLMVVLIGAFVFARGVGLGQKPRNPGAPSNDGLPHTLAELNAWYVEPPDGQNAAKVISEGISALHLANVESSAVPLLGRGKLPPLGASVPASVKSSLSGLVRANRDALQLFGQATQLELSRYPVDFNLGTEATLPHLNKMLDRQPPAGVGGSIPRGSK